MKQPLFISNIPIDEKRISFIERVVSQMARRSKKTTSAIITPYPISSCTIGEDVKGDILRYLFCAKGVLKKLLIVLGNKPSTGVSVDISISNDAGGSTKNYIVTKKTSIFEPAIEVFSSDKLSVSISPIDPEKDKVTEVWVAFMWVPSIGEAEIKKCLIDSLEEEADDLSEE